MRTESEGRESIRDLSTHLGLHRRGNLSLNRRLFPQPNPCPENQQKEIIPGSQQPLGLASEGASPHRRFLSQIPLRRIIHIGQRQPLLENWLQRLTQE